MRYILVVMVSVVINGSILAQETIEGKIEGWNIENAQVLTGTSRPIEIGQIDSKGAVRMTLTKSFVTDALKEIEDSKKETGPWKMTVKTLEELFSCDDSTVTVINGTDPIINLSTMGRFSIGNIEEQKMHGSLLISDSKEFSEAFLAFGKFKTITGYYLDWFYLENECSVKGNCSINSYTVASNNYSSENIYNMEFKSGWNIVSYEIAEVFVDEDGKRYPSKVIWKTLDSLPKDVQFVFTPR